jgi:uncharacterized protein (TIGR02266 family)
LEASVTAVADSDIQCVFLEYIGLDRERDASGISGPVHERWSLLKRKLNVHFQPDLETRHADRRNSIRVPTRLELRYESSGFLGESLITNVSREGVFIATKNPLAIGAAVDLYAFFDSDGRELTFDLKGTVASHHTGSDLYGEQFGMGVRFCGLDEDQRKWVDEMYGQAVQRAVGISIR